MSDEVQRSLGRIEGKLDSALELIKDHIAEDKVIHGTQSTRMGKVERRQAWVSGASAAIGAIFGALMGK